jgi:hypothetical protein
MELVKDVVKVKRQPGKPKPPGDDDLMDLPD